MEAFVKRKIFYNKQVFLEKTLPKEGEILVKKDDHVRSFDILGRTFISLNKKNFKLPPGAKILVGEGESVSYDQILAKKRSYFRTWSVRSPFAGTVKINGPSELELCSPAEKFNLVSGIDARVFKVIDKLSVLLSTDAVVVEGVWATGGETVGEMKIIDNGGQVLETRDLGADDLGKIIVYYGCVSENALKKSKALGVVGFICASLENSDKNLGVNVLVTEGFGPALMPGKLRQYLSEFSLRTAVISPDRKQLIIPGAQAGILSLDDPVPQSQEIKKGDHVQILVWPYFSQEAEVLEIINDFVFESGISAPALSLKLPLGQETVKIPVENVLILD